MRPLVIYHGGCRDGFCAAWVCHRALREYNPEFFEGYYGREPPVDLARNRDVVLVDFSYPLDQMRALAEACATLLVLDHHKTAEAALRDFRAVNARVVFDMDRSGAGLAWDNYFPGQVRPMPVAYTEDRDLWRFALPESRDVNAYLSTLPFEFEAWAAAETTAAQDCMEGYDAWFTAAKAGRSVAAKTSQYVREVLKNARSVTFEGHDVRIVNAPQVDISELLDALTIGSTFAMGWWQRADGVFQHSLRSRGDFDVSELAKRYGGGGHKNAAGFQSATLLALPSAGAGSPSSGGERSE